jgi:hypothetical protein
LSRRTPRASRCPSACARAARSAGKSPSAQP